MAGADLSGCLGDRYGSVAVVMANLYLNDLDDTFVAESFRSGWEAKLYRRFVDNVFIIAYRRHFASIHIYLNR